MIKYINKADIVKLINDCMFDLSDSDDLTRMLTEVDELPTVKIINCKDCRKHNIEIGDYEELPDGKRRWFWKSDSCPLIAYRGKAKGHEFDYQYCSCAKRRED
jgi:hypothetical protein